MKIEITDTRLQSFRIAKDFDIEFKKGKKFISLTFNKYIFEDEYESDEDHYFDDESKKIFDKLSDDDKDKIDDFISRIVLE